MRAKKDWVRLLGWSSVLTLGLFLAYLSSGSVDMPLQDLVSVILRGPNPNDGVQNLILWQIRMPRALACAFAGAALGVVGATFQALFRNALAEPYVIGVSSGAAVGGTFAVLLGMDFGLARVALAIIGSLLSLVFVLMIARKQGGVNVASLLIGGVVIGSLLSGVVTLNLSLAGMDTGKILWWLLGSTNPMFWDRTVVLGVSVVLAMAVLYRQSRALNAFAVSEFMADRQGVAIGRLKGIVLFTSAALTGVTVGTVGIIGFVGLVAPHISRRIVGSDLRLSMPLSAALGSTLLLAADIAAQRLRPGSELPLGAVTAVLGAPVLLWLISKDN